MSKIKKQKKKKNDMIKNLDYVKSLGLEIKRELVKGNCEIFARLMNSHWQYKLKRSKNMSNKTINEIYNFAMKMALGGKINWCWWWWLPSFLCKFTKSIKESINKKLEEVKFKFDTEGVKQIF